LRPPAPVLELARTLVDAGYETWCVGGAVRDAMLDIVHLDWDLATAARPSVVQRLFRRTVPIGVRFGTVGVIDRTGHMHEVTTFRRDIKTDGRHAEVEFGVSLHDDLARRDFTINAMAWDPLAERLEDPFDGRGDLERGLVRAVGDPNARFAEDRLRALRAIRFAARFGFEIEPATWTAIRESAPYLGRLSAERVKQELDKTMEQVRRPSVALRRWKESGAFATLVPPLATVSDRALLATDALPAPGLATRPLRRNLRHAALFSEIEPKLLARVLKDLKFSNQESTVIGALVGSWAAIGGTIGERLRMNSDITPVVVRRWVASIGRLRAAAFDRLAAALWWADSQLGNPAPAPAAWRALHRKVVACAFRDPLDVADLAIDGETLRRAGLPSGPALGRTLRALVDFVIEQPERNRTELLLEEARRIAPSVSEQPNA
jgi:tRNA nucleotidyltransferase (CCA-adding enzyme)